MKFEAEVDGETVAVDVTGGDGHYRVTVGGDEWRVDARRAAEGLWSILIDGTSHVADVSERDGLSHVVVEGERYAIRVEEETRYLIRTRGGSAATHGQVLKAPMPGKVVQIEVEVGQAVQAGDGLVILEAMKMENEFRASTAGRVAEIRVEVGQAVNPGDVLLVIE